MEIRPIYTSKLRGIGVFIKGPALPDITNDISHNVWIIIKGQMF